MWQRTGPGRGYEAELPGSGQTNGEGMSHRCVCVCARTCTGVVVQSSTVTITEIGHLLHQVSYFTSTHPFNSLNNSTRQIS